MEVTSIRMQEESKQSVVFHWTMRLQFGESE